MLVAMNKWNKRLAKKLKEKSEEWDFYSDFEKLWHITRNLESHKHV